MPECASPPSHGSAWHIRSLARSAAEAVPLMARTTLRVRSSAATKYRGSKTSRATMVGRGTGPAASCRRWCSRSVTRSAPSARPSFRRRAARSEYASDFSASGPSPGPSITPIRVPIKAPYAADEKCMYRSAFVANSSSCSGVLASFVTIRALEYRSCRCLWYICSNERFSANGNFCSCSSSMASLRASKISATVLKASDQS
mmetsp:Transcript_18543/g.32462  ORF Transcript_18543/g.32462 Transcript_18543/m.32462 type:complete len:202 (-) Transcript_18543:305-910(-)